MKIKISYTDCEAYKAEEIEALLCRLFKSEKSLKIRKPEKNETFHHTYFAIGKNK